MSEFRSGNGSAWLDLLTTLGDRYREVSVDRLSDAGALRRWLATVGLEPAEQVTEDDLRLVVETREALHRVTVAAIAHRPPDRADVRALEMALSYDRPPALDATERGLAPGPPRTAKEALARLVRAAVTVLTSDDIAYLRHCGDDTCSGIFVDHTGRRKWCLDLSCGNRARVRAHRAKASGS